MTRKSARASRTSRPTRVRIPLLVQVGLGEQHTWRGDDAVGAEAGQPVAKPASPCKPATLAVTGITIPSAVANAETVRRLRLDGRSSTIAS